MSPLRHVLGWLVFGMALYLGLSFTTYQPLADLPGAPLISNLGGPLGLFLADLFVEPFGIGAYLLCFHLVFVGARIQATSPMRQKTLKMVGLVVGMLTFGTFWQAALPARVFPGGAVPLGGILGFELATRLIDLLGTPWTLLTLALGIAASALVATDDLIPGVLRRFRRSQPAPGRRKQPAPRKRPARRPANVPDLAADDASDGEDSPAPRPRKRRAGAAKRTRPIAVTAGDAPDPEALEEELDTDAARISALENDDEPFEPEAEAVLAEELPDEDEADDVPPVPARRTPPRIRAAAAPPPTDNISVIRLSPDPKMRGKEKYELPPLGLLSEPVYLEERESDEEIQAKAAALEQALLDFGVTAKVEEVERGPVITRFDLSIARGTKISKVTGLADEVAMAIGVPRVRIAPVKGRPVLGVEIPNRERETVYLRELLLAADLRKRKVAIPLFLGKDASGVPIVEDLTTTPHLLIAGRTGAGKSVFVNNLVLSILLTRYPEEVRLIMIDPKKVELEVYQDIPHLLTKVESNSKKATKILEWAVDQMEERYELLAATGVRHLTSFNKLSKKDRETKLGRIFSPEEIERLPEHLPYIVIIVDELADLMMVAGKEVEQAIARLAQKARAVGIHVVLATQRPSTDVITGLIKSNLPARIAFNTRTGIDSRTILDRYGAEKLLDRGDMLYLSATSDEPRRVQGPFVSDDEVEKVVSYLKETASPLYTHKLEQVSAATRESESGMERDELFEQAVDIVLSTGQASASFLQRRMQVGYARASRLIDLMAEAGLVSEHRGSKAREILVSQEQWEEMRANAAGASSS